MFDYSFHHPESQTGFTRFLEEKSIPYECQEDMLGRVVAIPEDIDDDVLDEVEACYETLQRNQEALLFSAADNDSGKTSTAVTIELASGQTVYASVPADMMRRLLTVLSPEEIGELVDAIASAVENPDLRPICKR
jgi:hypothetical protein